MDYQKGKIYKIESHLGPKIYVGATTKDRLSQRMASHRNDYNKWKNGKNAKTMSFDIFEEYGFENCQIILLEPCSFKSIDELRAREAFYIQSNTCINRMIPNRTLKEWYNDNRDEKLKKVKEYQEQNKEKIKEYAKNYRESKKQNVI